MSQAQLPPFQVHMGLGNSHPRHKPLFLPGLLSQRDWLGIPTNSKTWEKSHPTSYLKSEMKCSSSDDMNEKSGMCVLSKEVSSWHLERWCPSQLILRSVFLSFPLDNKETGSQLGVTPKWSMPLKECCLDVLEPEVIAVWYRDTVSF